MDASLNAFTTPADSLSQTAKPPKFAKDMSPQKMRESAEDFEAFFLTQFLSQMFKGIKTDGPLGGGHGESVYRELQFQEYGKIIASQGGVGIADSIMRQLLNTQEVTEGTAK